MSIKNFTQIGASLWVQQRTDQGSGQNISIHSHKAGNCQIHAEDPGGWAMYTEMSNCDRVMDKGVESEFFTQGL